MAGENLSQEVVNSRTQDAGDGDSLSIDSFILVTWAQHAKLRQLAGAGGNDETNRLDLFV